MAVPKSLTIVVGAGASKEFNLPIGSELKSQISRMLDIRFEFGHQQERGDVRIMDAIRLKASEHSQDPNDYLHAAWQIRDALPLAPSIDQYINTQRGNSLIELCGKFAIVRAILQAEKMSSLYFNPNVGQESFNLEATSNTWLGCLLRMIVDGCEENELDERFKSITLIIFNYDRCIEHYLYHALQKYYKLSAQRAAELVSRIRVLHPYGSVGKLPWQSNTQHLAFGVEPSGTQIVELASKIKTFTEGTDPAESDMIQIRTSLAMAPRVLFLGFAFHPLNLELIAPQSTSQDHADRRVFGTALGISEYDCAEISDDLCRMLNCTPNLVHIRNDLTASQIFSEFSRGLSFQRVAV